MWYVYVAEFLNGALYTGITVNVQRRIEQHNNGSGAKSLRGKGPVKLVYFERSLNRATASKREREIKGWGREKKLKLIQGFTLNERSS